MKHSNNYQSQTKSNNQSQTKSNSNAVIITSLILIAAGILHALVSIVITDLWNSIGVSLFNANSITFVQTLVALFLSDIIVSVYSISQLLKLEK
ncbi:MAG: hypothetical protein HQL46_14945 [Gammaproteobacteria bacterium]|nr:hypothetical protein [Gammaproteobacteria bacterium]